MSSAEERARSFLKGCGIEPNDYAFQAPIIALNSLPPTMVLQPQVKIEPPMSDKERHDRHEEKEQQKYLDGMAPTSTLSRTQERELDQLFLKIRAGGSWEEMRGIDSLNREETQRLRKLLTLHDRRSDQ